LKARIDNDEPVVRWKNVLMALTLVVLLTDKPEATLEQLSIETTCELLTCENTETIDPMRA
jgi:hypothetical protein